MVVGGVSGVVGSLGLGVSVTRSPGVSFLTVVVIATVVVVGSDWLVVVGSDWLAVIETVFSPGTSLTVSKAGYIKSIKLKP